MFVRKQGTEQVPRGRQVSGSQLAANAARVHRNVEAILEVKRVLQSRPLDEADEFRAARQVHVLSVIDDAPVNLKRGRASSEQPASFEEMHFASALLEIRGRSEPRQAAAGDCYPGRSHDATTTRNFSPFESAARARSGRCGSRSIFSKMRS